MLLIGNIIKQLLLSLSPGSLSLFASDLLFSTTKTEENTEDIYQKESEVRIQLIAAGMQVKVKASELMFYLNFLSTKEVLNLQY